MLVSETIKNYSVRVNSGSGVLVNAMTNRYTYVFTAIHVLDADDAKNEVTDSNGNSLSIIRIYRHPDYIPENDFDCAIIQIEYLENINQQTIEEKLLEYNASIAMAGYPGVESQTSFPFQQYNGRMVQNPDHYLVVNLDGTPSKTSIDGMSGSGIYYIQEDTPYLVGVEYRMHNTPGNQQYNFVRCRSLKIYQDIIYANELAPTLPPFLECFSRFKNEIFNFNVANPLNIERLRSKLIEISEELVSRGMPKPYELMEKYNSDLLISSKNPEDVKSKELWVAYFEFLIICVLIDGVGVIDENYLKSIERKRRIIYTTSDRNWTGQLRDILIKAKKILDENGTLIVVSPEKDADRFPEGFQIDRVIRDISTIPITSTGSFIQINNPHSLDIYKSFVLQHYSPLRKECVIRKEEQIAQISDIGQLLMYFRDSFNETIK